MTHIILQGLTGKPGFISDPTVDEAKNSIILAHCLGSRKMDGPGGPIAPYKFRTIMERQEGVVPQVEMRVGQRVTQAILIGTDSLLYFTGEIIEAPVKIEDERGCRTKIDVRVDGDVTALWKNWSSGLHRQTVYGDITKDLQRFCRYEQIKLIDEAATGVARSDDMDCRGDTDGCQWHNGQGVRQERLAGQQAESLEGCGRGNHVPGDGSLRLGFRAAGGCSWPGGRAYRAAPQGHGHFEPHGA
jgi:L-fucose isomerase-like protein